MFDNPMLLPEIQTSYGQGIDGEARDFGNESWGPKISNGNTNHIKDFFETGTNYINSVSIASGNDRSRMYASYSNTNATSMIPNYGYNRNNFTVRGSTPVFRDKVQLNASINYITGVTRNRNASGWYSSPMFGLYLFPMGVDMGQYRANGGAVWDETRLLWAQNWPFIRNEHSSNQNPYWLVNHYQGDDKFNRTNIMASAKWDITDWLSATGRSTLNMYNSSNEDRVSATSDPTVSGVNGNYGIEHNQGKEWYSDVMLNVNKNFGTISLNAFVGASQTTWYNYSISNNSVNSIPMLYPNFFSVYNLTGNFEHEESETREMNRSIMGAVNLGYADKLFLDVSARNEWSSTVDEAFFYPSVGLSYILSEDLPQSDVVSHVKLRASYAEVGNSLPWGASEIAPNYTISPSAGTPDGRGSLPFFSGTDTISLRPERTKSYEFGADFGFFNNSLNLTVTYYNATTDDQVFRIQAPAGSGANQFWINGGSIQNLGIEAGLSYNKQFGEVTWRPSVNFTRNTNRIKQLSDLLSSDRFVLTTGNRLTNLYLLRPGSELLNGRKYGAYHDIFGRSYQYDENGNQLFDPETGMPVLSELDDQYLGNANPDFLLNMNNQFTYKDFSLSFLLDSRWGGIVASSTDQWLDYKGLSKRSGDARDAGGVKLSNGTVVDAQAYYNYISAGADARAAAQEYLFDATNIRLREIAIGYTLPKFTDRIRSINVSLIARNLFFLYKKAPFDPELSVGRENNQQGFQNFQTPSPRSIGVSLRIGL